MRCLSDAAEALDYLYEEHSLQHLDIKPENLLFVGNRIKIADFGLVRNLRELGDSLGGGLTPLYSAPEVLRGKPSRTSDQYSLAIVYQQMLTGEPPFAGRTSAQLAAQHHHCKPVLTPLPQPDQVVVARALVKEPVKRFPGCRVLIENLQRAGIHGSGSRRTKTSRRTPSNSQASNDTGSNGVREDLAVAKTTPFSLENSAVEKLPAIDISKQTTEYRPAIFVGLGHTGVQALARLHQRLEENYGELDHIPCLQMLLIDTDEQSLGQATEAKTAAGVRGHDTLVMPLRRPNEYRAKSEQLLQWLSRRWLYNIPRSLSTEGFRPLGRLALIDNCDKLIERLRNAIAIVTDPESLAMSTRNAGIAFQKEPPRVFIVASTAGGTGSGAVLDLAYLVRELLVEQGLSDDAVYGILAHSTTHKADIRDLAVANTYAFLMELKHLTRVGGHYPGDAAFRLLASYQRDAVFRHSYLVHLGDELNDAQYNSAVDGLAEYLYLNCATPACAFFDRSREQATGEDKPDQTNMRTFAIGKTQRRDDDLVDSELALLCRSTIQHWLGIGASCDNADANQGDQQEGGDASCVEDQRSAAHVQGIVARRASSLDLKLASLVEHAIGIVQSEFGGDVDGHLGRMIESVKSSRQQAEGNASAQAVAAEPIELIERMLARPSVDRQRASQANGLRGVLTGQMARFLAHKTKAARQWLTGLLEIPDARLDRAWQAATCFARQLGKLESSASQVRQRLGDEVAGLKTQAAESQPDRLLLQYGRLRVYEMAHRCVRDGVRAMRLEMTAIAEDFQKLRGMLIGVAAEFESQCAANEDEQVPDADGGTPDQENSAGPTPRLLELMDRQMRNRFAGAGHSLHGVLTGRMRDPNLLYKSLRETGRVILRTRFAEGDRKPSERATSNEQIRGDTQALIDGSTPKLLDCGGAKRMLMVAGDQSDLASMKRGIEQATGDSVTALACPGSDTLLCCEMERVPLDNIAASLIGGRREYAELASRLHTRIDVKWPDE